ncbi:winged helix DNA-binding protein [Glaciimonas soli]|uniref:Winged helix DNA-binding protein n=1 Tax=Glaciimonas soli TaxID=2590999 RepID=A0A843YQP2_9BURK|nr:winged helix DNA-binding protein [Glaciimonas soli]MQQ99601.1 winged helix DNA-binding protein [Glaciimonas soli]
MARPAASDFDLHWHLATTDHEIAVTEFEFCVLRMEEAFQRWQSECLAAGTAQEWSGFDNAVLHVLRMKDRPKSVTEIARVLNRDDLSALQYSLRKLQSQKLIEKEVSTKGLRRGVRYQVTEHGRKVTENFAENRRALLISLTSTMADSDEQLKNATRTMAFMTGIYEHAARIAATHALAIDVRQAPQLKREE